MQDRKLYLKIEQNIEICNKKVFFSDLGTFYSPDAKMVHDIMKTEFLKITAKESTKYCISIMKVVEAIVKKYPDVEVINMGENDFVLSYVIPGKKSQSWEYIKASFVCLIVGIGSAFSIMTFNTDVSVSDVFQKSYELVLGQGAKSNGVVELAYSAGITVGICIFFNHFTRKATHNDPTPLQVEMRIYEQEVNTAMIKNSAREGKTIDAN